MPFSLSLAANGESYIRFYVLGTDFGRFTISSFFGGREFSFPWWVVVTSVGHRTNGRLPHGPSLLKFL